MHGIKRRQYNFFSKEQRLDTDIRHVVIFSVHQMCDMGIPQLDGVI